MCAVSLLLVAVRFAIDNRSPTVAEARFASAYAVVVFVVSTDSVTLAA